ncbi:MAG: hypothetical protein K1Y36_11515 [Blastocatellia bacterium]|nr:hypothetical protein [Blastocatellia bacterium]
MPTPFDAIGFHIADENSFERLAKYTREHGRVSTIHRRGASLHGHCWKLNEGLEVWTVLHEAQGHLTYADCRPAFRSRHRVVISPWELTEYDEDGEAIVRGTVDGRGVLVGFEVQNLTEVSDRLFRRPVLQVCLAGLAYTVKCHSRKGTPLPGSFELATTRTAKKKRQMSCETDYELTGKVLSCKLVRNLATRTELVMAYIDTGRMGLDIVAESDRVRGTLEVGGIISARVWLQGYILDDAAVAASYEGVDRNFPTGAFWTGLHHPN